MVDPRNVIFINEYNLLASAKNETLNNISTNQLRKAIKNFLSGVTENDDYSIYDSAVYAC
jgi:F0F1-type ATP synthase delta subunit